MFDGLSFPKLLAVLAAVFFLFIFLQALRSKKLSVELPYERRERLMTEAEGSFYQVLELALPEESYRLFGKVRVEDLISVKPGLDRRTWQSARNRIKSRHIDIVIVERKTFQPVWAVELDDKSHNSAKRERRDSFLDKAFEVAGLPLLRFKAKRSYTVAELQRSLGIGSSVSPTEGSVIANGSSMDQSEETFSASHVEDIPERFCPRCYAPMARKRLRSGKRAGAEILACSRYPKCRQLLPISSTGCVESGK